MKTLRLLPMVYALLLVTFVTIGCTHQRHQNEVDRIRSEDDVRAFLRKHGSHSVASVDPFLIKECDTIRTLTTPFFKADIDHNGQTDLIVNGRESVIVAMHQHDESYEIHVMPINGGKLYGYEVDSIVDTDSLCFIYVSNRLNPCNNDLNFAHLPVIDGRDTLIGFEGKLVKYRPQKSSKRISQIRLCSDPGLSGDRQFSIEVDTLGAVMYSPKYESYTVHSTIGSDSCSRIFRLAERIQPEQLDSVYMDSIDEPSARIEFVFEDGTMKYVITDGHSDPGLKSLWWFIDDIRYTHGWHFRRKQ